MKKLLIIIFIFISYFSHSQDRKLSLSECIDLAIENNENLKNSKLEERISKSLSKEYLSIGFPQINFDGGLKYNHDVPKSLIDISRFMPGVPEGTEQEVQFGQTYDGRADLFINQMIFNGSYFVGLSAAKELVRLSEKLTTRNEIDIHESVQKAYYTVLNTRSRVNLVLSNLNRLSILLDETKQLYDNGFIEKLDVDRIQVAYNNLKSEQIKAETYLKLSKEVLNFQIGLPVGTQIQLEGELNSEILKDFSYSLDDFGS